MRITESRLMQLASNGSARARVQVGEATASLTDGMKVRRPSDDPSAWAAAERAKIRLAANSSGTSGIGRSRDRLRHAENSLANVQGSLDRARDLAVQMASSLYLTQDRASAAVTVRAIREDVIAALNTRDPDGGEYLFAGSRGEAPAFDAAGAYGGDGEERVLEAIEGSALEVTISGARFTAAGGADVLGALEALALALEADDPAATSASIAGLDGAQDAISAARSRAGYSLSALDDAELARSQLEIELTSARARLTEADPIEAATTLANARISLDAAGAISAQLFDMLRTR